MAAQVKAPFDCFAERINGRPNSRGGMFFASGHCARQYIVLGETIYLNCISVFSQWHFKERKVQHV